MMNHPQLAAVLFNDRRLRLETEARAHSSAGNGGHRGLDGAAGVTPGIRGCRVGRELRRHHLIRRVNDVHCETTEVDAGAARRRRR